MYAVSQRRHHSLRPYRRGDSSDSSSLNPGHPSFQVHRSNINTSQRRHLALRKTSSVDPAHISKAAISISMKMKNLDKKASSTDTSIDKSNELHVPITAQFHNGTTRSICLDKHKLKTPDQKESTIIVPKRRFSVTFLLLINILKI